MSVNEKMTAIADAIRAKTGGTKAMTLDQMAAEIAGLELGAKPVLEPLSVSENGEYTPDDGVDGFSKVIVNIADHVSWETTEYIHSENWTDNSIGLAGNFANLYCNDYDTDNVTVFDCEVTGNPQTYRYALGMICIRYKSYIIGNSFRWYDSGSVQTGGVDNNTALFMVAGAVVTVRKFVVSLEEDA